MRLNLIILILVFFAGNLHAQTEQKKPNILFIAVDDMADWAGYLNHPNALTPNMDRLAKQGIVFSNAQCTSPICGPSRAAIMTGMRPETTKIYSNKGDYLNYVPNAISLPEYFKKNGYYTAGAGKLIHPYNNVVPKAFNEFGPGVGIVGSPFTDQELSTENMDPTVTVDRLKVTLPMNEISTLDRPNNRWSTFDWGPLDVTDDEMPDGKIANWAVQALQKEYDQPLFLGVGFYKPHLPFFAPKKYFDLYDINNIELPITRNNDLKDLSKTAKLYAKSTSTAGLHKTVLKHKKWKEGVLAYVATISFVDAQIGEILDALEKSRLADNTLIIFWSDHGFHLGEKEHWAKQTLWERTARVPMIIVQPKNQKKSNVHLIRNPVNLLDVYPTLVAMCNLPKNDRLEGENLLPLIKNPTQQWKNISITSMGRSSQAIRSTKWRYIRYFDGSEELYDMKKDPHEFTNLASKRKYIKIKQELAHHFVKDPTIKRSFRYKKWKVIEEVSGNMLVFDLESPPGLTETRNLASERKGLVIYLKKRLLSLPDDKTRFVLE